MDFAGLQSWAQVNDFEDGDHVENFLGWWADNGPKIAELLKEVGPTLAKWDLDATPDYILSTLLDGTNTDELANFNQFAFTVRRLNGSGRHLYVSVSR